MKIMFIGSEATPFSKTGGLADVLGSLPYALHQMGHDITIVLPKHKVTKDKFEEKLTVEHTTTVPVKDKKEFVGYEILLHHGVKVVFVDNEYYFGYRENLYGDYDDGERYGYFSQAVVRYLKYIKGDIDILHLNDWQTGLIPYLLQCTKNSALNHIKTVFTIHNIAYQGRFDKALMPYLNVPYSDILEFDDTLNFLKTGIVSADWITTVSKSYAEELTYAYFGYGMEDLLKERQNTFIGIMNGINYDEFSPNKDSYIAFNYGIHNYLKGKEKNRQALLKMFHIEAGGIPIIGIVSRLAEQKGFNLLRDIIEDYLEKDRLKLIVLGSGDDDLEGYFDHLKQRFHDHVGVYFGYHEKMARQIYAGADFFLMPSRYEPCGLSQLISLKYGTIPIIRQTGGLKDSIEPYNRYTHKGSGIGFLNFSKEDLKRALDEAVKLYQNQTAFKQVKKRGMQADFSWQQSALQYEKLYQKLGD